MTAALCAWAQEPCPEVIPALQQWQGGKGRLSLPVSGEIVVDPLTPGLPQRPGFWLTI